MVHALHLAFAHLPASDRRALEAPVTRLHTLPNRVAHHEPLITEPLAERYADVLTVVGYVDPALRTWVAEHNTVPAVLSARP